MHNKIGEHIIKYKIKMRNTNIKKTYGVLLVQSLQGEDTAGKEQTGAVGSGVVGQTGLEAVLLQVVGVGRRVDAVSLQLGGGDLAHDVTVGDADNHAVLGGLVLVLVLGEHATTLTVVSLSLTPPPVLDLVTLEVSIVLLNLDETHGVCFVIWNMFVGFKIYKIGKCLKIKHPIVPFGSATTVAFFLSSFFLGAVLFFFFLHFFFLQLMHTLFVAISIPLPSPIRFAFAQICFPRTVSPFSSPMQFVF